MPVSLYRWCAGTLLILGFAAGLGVSGGESIAAADDGSAAFVAADGDSDSSAETVGFRRRRPCPPGWVEVAPTETAPQAAPTPGAVAPPEEAIPPGALASAIGAAPGPATATPNMIGDSLSGGGFGGMRFFGASENGAYQIQGASVGLAGGDRRFKIADDENPLPSDRFYFDYNHFQDPLVDIRGNPHNLDAYTFGAEKTFRDGLWSLGLVVPFSTDFNSVQSTVPGASLAAAEFGDVTLVVKRALVRREHFALSAGLGIVFPSGDDFDITDSGGTLVEVRNRSTHLDPFIGAIWTPTDRLFFLFFGQLDFDTFGDPVLMRGIGPAGGVGSAGVFHEQSLGMLDMSVGYRLYQNPNARFLTGIVPMAELHYTSTLSNMDLVTGPLGSIGAGNPAFGPVGDGRRDILNMTGGLEFQLGPVSSLTVAGVAPLTSGFNREFTSEFIVEFDRRF